MAATTNNTTTNAWESALANYQDRRAEFETADLDREQAEVARDAAELHLLLTPAPDLKAVAIKMRAIWNDNFTMMSTGPYVIAQQMIIDEVARLPQAAA